MIIYKDGRGFHIFLSGRRTWAFPWDVKGEEPSPAEETRRRRRRRNRPK